jgi:hypothetical protein
MVLVIGLSIMGCATNFTASNGKLSYGTISGKAGDEFKASKRITYIFHPQFIQIGEKTQEKLETIIEPKIAEAGGKGATNLKVTMNMDGMAFIINYITAGLLGMPAIEVTGQIVK